jgi:hypothetical protein
MSGHRRGARAPQARVELSEIDRLYVDGNNLLHRRAGTPGGGAPSAGAVRLLLASMRAAVPETIDAVLMLDGQPDPGAPSRQKIRNGLEVRHAGRVDADSVLVEMVASRPFSDRWRTLVVSDDRALSERVRHAGGRVARLDWLDGLLRRVESGAPAAGPGTTRPHASISQDRPPPTVRPPRPARPIMLEPTLREGGPDPDDDTDARPPWRPGRGATRKRGNPRKGPSTR